MNVKRLSIALIATLLVIMLTPLFVTESTATQYLTSHWENWNDEDSVSVELLYVDMEEPSELQEQLSEIFASEGWSPASEFYCFNPYVISNGGWNKGVWLADVPPTKCVWIYYDPLMHKMYETSNKPHILAEGDFDGWQYAFADYNNFKIPALFLSDRYGNWAVRSYFVFEDGKHGGEGPVVESDGTSKMLAFPVNGGSAWDLMFKAPILIMGYMTIPLFFWLTPLWAFLVFFVVMVVWTKSVVVTVDVVKNAVSKTGEARQKWRTRS